VGFEEWTTASLWLAVVASGIYHGLNPGMGWPLAISAGLMGNGRRDVVAAFVPIAAGHLLAMTGMLLPFALMSLLVVWQKEIRLAAAVLVIAFGLYLFVNRRHPRFLARIRPTQLALWSFAVAIAHGAALMLVPIYLGLCQSSELDGGHRAALALMGGHLTTAIAVALVHTAAMMVSGGLVALAVHAWLGPAFISRSWFNLDAAWALSLVLVGVIALADAARIAPWSG
jgi:hypothetical protein